MESIAGKIKVSTILLSRRIESLKLKIKHILNNELLILKFLQLYSVRSYTLKYCDLRNRIAKCQVEVGRREVEVDVVYVQEMKRRSSILYTADVFFLSLLDIKYLSQP